MDTAPATSSSKPRWLFWLIGILALLWNSAGALDYSMTELRVDSYMKSFTPDQLAYFYGFPAWVIGTWALSVWGGVAGSLALLMRSRRAVLCFTVSLLAMIPTFFHNYFLTNGYAVMGGAGAATFTAVIVAVGAGLLWYSRSLASKGTLR